MPAPLRHKKSAECQRLCGSPVDTFTCHDALVTSAEDALQLLVDVDVLRQRRDL
eukprot:CAMPEP_0176185080 /NCGR_PEP_ID=MMETSP0121_2-20121125/1164_1 /TAXON_ID=160619 /ORGANISM="Kryptoperidinium foliaceum, Strain CCMP 1326" /LENGTH=53 /DNA_ID=CAMNT_0017523511 /DNA_START=430 /DNA_END=591 /DNA_ORIENTATION=-